MSDKYLVIFTNKETGKYHHYDLYPKEVATEEELLQKVDEWNCNENSNLKATYHNNDVFADFIEDVSNAAYKKRVITHLKDLINSIHDDIYELENWTNDIQELLEDFDNDRK